MVMINSVNAINASINF